MEDASTQPLEPAIWAAVANVKNPCRVGPEGGKPQRGTKHFKGGAKVYVIDAYWGTCDRVTAIGIHRKSRRYICVDMPARHLENLRSKLVYSPAVRKLTMTHFGTERELPTEDDALKICEALPHWNELLREHKLKPKPPEFRKILDYERTPVKKQEWFSMLVIFGCLLGVLIILAILVDSILHR